MFEFEKPRIEIAEKSDDNRYGKFVVEPLERGYGTTLGNALRRVMLSSLPGIAVSSVKIKGALHEFTSIPGVKEDVTEIVLNIKELHLKNNSTDNDPKLGYIEASGEGVVTAGDIKFDGDIEVLNPELVIANLSGKDARLDMTLTVTNGRGYVSADKNKEQNFSIDAIAVDSIYTPIERVNLTVENTRVGQITDYDKLTLDVYTNGTLAPDDAVSIKEFAELCAHSIDRNICFKTPDNVEQKEHSPISSQVLDNTKLRNLGWKSMFSVEKGIRHTIEIGKKIGRKEYD